jgi:hypothetical protein
LQFYSIFKEPLSINKAFKAYFSGRTNYDKDQTFKDEFQESRLSESTGWWTPEGDIYVWTKGTTRRQQIGIAVHESFEWFLIVKMCRKKFRWLYKRN